MAAPAINVVLVEDDAADALLVERSLSRSPIPIQLQHFSSLRDGEAHLASHAVDVVVLDLALPDGTGLDNLKAIEQVNPLVPIVILTDNDDDCLAMQAVEAGAVDGDRPPGVLSRANLLRCCHDWVVLNRGEAPPVEAVPT